MATGTTVNLFLLFPNQEWRTLIVFKGRPNVFKENRVKHRRPARQSQGILTGWFIGMLFFMGGMSASLAAAPWQGDNLSDADQKLVEASEQYRIKAIQRVIGSVIAIYDNDRQGGGSGVIIDPSGIALTNHHVIMGAGVEGWGGLADGKLYPWKLIGTDPGGDVSMIQMMGKDDFPFTPLGDSNQVRVGDWALAMGNPFILTEDQSPTVTLGIVSGIKRYQPGAGLNQLVYGNCIQVDSSINPGNSGGPLFNFNGEIIGINGRGSFKERGRVNVGLGYAISSNQIKNFIPELLATKLVEHATLDASFSDRKGRVVCSQINLDSPVALAGLELGDELIEFEGIPIINSNQFTNLICTLPEAWPIEMRIRNSKNVEETIHVRALGLPYQKPKVPKNRSDREPTPQQKKQQKRQREMVKLLSATPGKIRNRTDNRKYVRYLIDQWKTRVPTDTTDLSGCAKLSGRINVNDIDTGTQTIWLACDGRFRVEWTVDGEREVFTFDGTSFFHLHGNKSLEMTLVEAKLKLPVIQAIAMTARWQKRPFGVFGKTLLDGSDKAQGHVASRMKVTDDDSDVFYYWLSLETDVEHRSSGLLKVSAFKDCEEGGVTFRDWRNVGPVRLPFRRDFITRLSEATALSITTESGEWLETIEDSWFEANNKDGSGLDDSAGRRRTGELDESVPTNGKVRQ